MEPFTTYTGIAAPLNRVNVDTDAIVPKQFLRKIERTGFGKHLFHEWRFAGCSMCLGMNDDQLKKGERCASSSNRNFEGRQGPGGRTHLMGPEMAAAAAITGKITDIRTFK